MKILNCIVCAAFFTVSLTPVKASEVGILLDKQFGQSISFHEPLPGYLADGSFRGSAVDPIGIGVRGAYTISNLKVCELGITATYHPKVKTDWDPTLAGAIHMSGKVGNEYFAIGAQADWYSLVNFHLGVDLRQESISSDLGLNFYIGENLNPPAPPITIITVWPGKTTITRPWINTGFGFSFPSASTTPFIRLEGSLALKTYSLPAADANGDDFRRVIAPKYQVSLYGGVRF